jgi:hypothetical protein
MPEQDVLGERFRSLCVPFKVSFAVLPRPAASVYPREFGNTPPAVSGIAPTHRATHVLAGVASANAGDRRSGRAESPRAVQGHLSCRGCARPGCRRSDRLVVTRYEAAAAVDLMRALLTVICSVGPFRDRPIPFPDRRFCLSVRRIYFPVRSPREFGYRMHKISIT